MAKRFTDTNKWRKEFIRGLQGPYKLLWIYILDECDHAGIWNVEMDVASIRIGYNVTITDSIKYFGNHIIPFDNNTKWFIPDFIDFQYGELNSENRAHGFVIAQLEKYKIKGHLRGLQGRKDKDKDKDKELDKDKEEREIFNEFRKKYPGTKRGNDIEFANFIKKHRDWREVLPLLETKLDYQISAKQVRKDRGLFVPEWKNLQTWINNRCWEEEINTDEIKKKTFLDV